MAQGASDEDEKESMKIESREEMWTPPGEREWLPGARVTRGWGGLLNEASFTWREHGIYKFWGDRISAPMWILYALVWSGIFVGIHYWWAGTIEPYMISLSLYYGAALWFFTWLWFRVWEDSKKSVGYALSRLPEFKERALRENLPSDTYGEERLHGKYIFPEGPLFKEPEYDPKLIRESSEE